MSTRSSKLSTFVIYILPSILWAGLIFYISSYPTATTSTVHWEDFAVKKFAHVLVYGIFTVLNYRAMIRCGIKSKDAAIFAILITFLYGSSDEFHQSFTPTREPTVRDALIDTTGGTIAILFIWKLLPKAPKPLTNLGKILGLL